MLDSYKRYFVEFHKNSLGGPFKVLNYGTDEVNGGTASSYESIMAYARYIDNRNAKVLNAGAGASSWMLRQMFWNITCTDPNQLYLDYIQFLCKKNEINSANFQRNMMFKEQFDHVYYDYGDIERLPYLGSAIDLAKKSVYVDDTDKRECCSYYRDFVFKLCKSLGLQCIDLEEATDEEGRGGLLIIK